MSLLQVTSPLSVSRLALQSFARGRESVPAQATRILSRAQGQSSPGRQSDRLTGIGWNTFDYILRDLNYPGCLSLFKLDSTNESFIDKGFGRKLNGDRTAYLELLAATGILDEYPPVVINWRCMRSPFAVALAISRT
jgi:hypothetical protein